MSRAPAKSPLAPKITMRRALSDPALLGDVVAGFVFQSGNFKRQDSLYVWGILAGSAVGLLASTLGRLYSSTYYALRDTRTPLNFAVRVATFWAGTATVLTLKVAES